MINKKLSQEELGKIRSDRKVRRSLASLNHYWFFCLYLGHYLKYEFANLHHEMFRITEDQDMQLAVLVAFRGSGKSTIITLSFPIWAIIGALQKKFILIVSQTQNQAKLHLESIKRELENNHLLKADVGPFNEPKDEWGANSIVIPKFDARITAASTEQSIRGIRHGQYRPDLIICDDIEDLNSVKTREGRERTHTWWNGEVIPVGDKDTKIVLVGNLLHEDCLIMRLRNQIRENKLEGSFFSFPLLDENDNALWPGKYPTQRELDKLKASFTQESAYYREYLLKIISDADRLVHPEWLHYYDDLPSADSDSFNFAGVGIDLAISQKTYADCTAMVSAYVFGRDEDLRVYILPNLINQKVDFPTAIEIATNLSKTVVNGEKTMLYIENVGYQEAFIQHLASKNIPVEGVSPRGQDKRTRLALVTQLIQQGKVWFPKSGCEELISQLVGFGIEKHDDLADAFSMLLLKVLEKDSEPEPRITIIDCGPIYTKRLADEYWSKPLSMDTQF